jgi:hypothetical protein
VAFHCRLRSSISAWLARAVECRDGTERDNRQLEGDIGRHSLNSTAVGAPRPERLASSNPALHVRPLASVAGDWMREVGRSAARSRGRATIGADAPLLCRRSRRNLEREPAAAVEAAHVPDIVELLQRLDRIRFATRWAAGNSPRACSDLHVACETMVAYSRRAVQSTSNQNGISRLAIRAPPKTTFRHVQTGSRLPGRLPRRPSQT